MGLSYTVISAEIDESEFPGETPQDYVCRIAAKKARWVRASEEAKIPILAADTVVVLDGKIMGKPGEAAAARDMLLALSGRTHEVYSAVVLLTCNDVEFRRLNVSRVTFASLHPDWVAAYSACAEPLDKAGAYAIQGLAAQYITRLEGSFSGVMGLPLFETMALLRQVGIEAPIPR